MRLCAGTAKGIVIIDPARGGRPLMALADPPSVWCMARDAGDPNLLFAGAVHNAFAGSARGRAALARSTDGGRSWSDITPGAARDEEVWAVAAAPGRSGTVYIGTSRARLFRSENAGASFRECAAPLRPPARDRFGAAATRASIRAIRFSPRDASVIHVVLEAAGVFRSTDGARSFESLARPAAEEFHDLAIDPEDSSRLIVATDAGVYFSATGGASWSRAAGLIREWAITLLFAGAGVGRSIFASAAAVPPPLWAMGPAGADAMIFRSFDQSRTYAPLVYADGAVRPGRGAAMRFAMNPEDPNDIFAAVSDGSILRIDAASGAARLIAERLPPVYDVLAIP
jgi:photosystem II stability/assembly factor-like uncharacterized protein